MTQATTAIPPSRRGETTEQLFARYGTAYRWLATITVITGMAAAVITTTTVNVAIPDIMGAFGIGQERAQLVSTAALAGTTVAMLLNAWMIATFGPRRTFLGALTVFIVALLVAGWSPNDLVLILARVMQGAVAGLLQPLAVYTLYRVFPIDQKGKAMGLFGITVILGPALGPTLGGLLIEHYNWRYIFFIAVPLAGIAMVMGSVFMPERDDTEKHTHFDWTAFGMLALAIGCLLGGLSNGPRSGWDSTYILSLFAVALASGIAFIVRQLRAPYPLVALRALAIPQFASACLVSCIFGVGVFGSIYLVPLFVQTIQGFTPLAAGLLLMPAGIILGAFLPLSGYMTDHLPTRPLIVVGLLAYALSSWWMGSVDANTPYWSLAWWIVFGRVGMGLTNPSLNVAALRALRPELLGQAAGMINFFRQLGGAFGVNLLAVLLDRRAAYYGDALTSLQLAGDAASAGARRSLELALAQFGAPPDLQSQGALQFLGRMVQQQAYTFAFRDAFLVVALVFALAIIPAWMIGSARPHEGERR